VILGLNSLLLVRYYIFYTNLQNFHGLIYNKIEFLNFNPNSVHISEFPISKLLTILYPKFIINHKIFEWKIIIECLM